MHERDCQPIGSYCLLQTWRFLELRWRAVLFAVKTFYYHLKSSSVQVITASLTGRTRNVTTTFFACWGLLACRGQVQSSYRKKHLFYWMHFSTSIRIQQLRFSTLMFFETLTLLNTNQKLSLVYNFEHQIMDLVENLPKVLCGASTQPLINCYKKISFPTLLMWRKSSRPFVALPVINSVEGMKTLKNFHLKMKKCSEISIQKQSTNSVKRFSIIWKLSLLSLRATKCSSAFLSSLILNQFVWNILLWLIQSLLLELVSMNRSQSW